MYGPPGHPLEYDILSAACRLGRAQADTRIPYMEWQDYCNALPIRKVPNKSFDGFPTCLREPTAINHLLLGHAYILNPGLISKCKRDPCKEVLCD